MLRRSQSIMANTGMSVRVTRLKSQSSVKTVPERKPKFRKVVTTNKNLKKVNVNASDKSLRVSKGNASLGNSQTSMRRCLRPRRNKKNYCEDSRLLQRFILPKQQDSVVMMEKLPLEDKKVPVYKALEPSEKSEDNDVYDFKFDSNDTKEKAVKKKQRKRNVNKVTNKTTKKTTRKKAQLKTVRHEAIKSPKPVTNLSVETVQNDPPLESVVVKKLTKEDNVKKTEILKINTDIQTLEESVNNDTEKEINPSRIDIADIETIIVPTEDEENIETSRVDTNIHKEITLPNTFAERVKKKNISKPRIISIEDASNIVVTKSPPNKTEVSWPFRPKNIFDNKTSKEHNSTLRCSLSMKALSPIVKMTNTLDFGSPWRPPILTFSQTKHFIQSTPYKNFEIKKENKIKKKSKRIKKKWDNKEMDKENIDINKENKAAPVRVSLGEIKKLLLRPNNNVNTDKQTVDQVQTEDDKSLVEQKNEQLINIRNFSDTFDVLSETEKLSNIENDIPLFMDLEPSHFSKPPRHSYRRKRAVKFDFFEDNSEEEENVKLQPKKKKLTKSEKEQEKKINEWVKTINNTFQEIEEHNLLIE